MNQRIAATSRIDDLDKNDEGSTGALALHVLGWLRQRVAPAIGTASDSLHCRQQCL